MNEKFRLYEIESLILLNIDFLKFNKIENLISFLTNKETCPFLKDFSNEEIKIGAKRLNDKIGKLYLDKGEAVLVAVETSEGIEKRVFPLEIMQLNFNEPKRIYYAIREIMKMIYPDCIWNILKIGDEDELKLLSFL